MKKKLSTIPYILSPEKGFTLIELLIVMVIIGILAALIMSNFLNIRQRARDAQRKSDMRQMQSALELYRSEQTTGQYPAAAGLSACGGANSITGNGTTYLQVIPCDPQGASAYHAGVYYYWVSAAGTSYYLVGCLENDNDPDGKTQPSGIAAPVCANGANNYYVVQNP